MKKLLLAVLICLAAGQLSAQIKKGQWLVGGSLSFTSSNYKNSSFIASSTNLTLNPAAGYFFIDKFAGGLKFAYAVSNPKGYKATTQYLAGPFLRYYFLPANQKVNIFFDGTYGFGSAHNEYGSFNSNMYVFAAGPAIFLNPHTALEFAVNYSSTGGELYGNGSRYNVVGFNIGFQIYLGK